MSKGNNKPNKKRGKQGIGKFKDQEMPSTAEYTRLNTEESSSEDEYRSRMKDGRKLKVYIYEGELNKIKDWVLLYKNIETGGDLFGLWIDPHTAVVQFVLGPGKDCRRHTTSFFQDLLYLATAGGYLTKKHGLCNIGQWHSHHQLRLNEPSGGDESTVWGNMPNLGLSRYIVCIANISKSKGNVYDAGVNCFLFEVDEQRRKLPVLKGEFEKMGNASPVTEHLKNAKEIAEGAEPPPEEKEEDETTESSCSRFFSNVWLSFLKIITSPTFRNLAIIAGIAVPFIVVGIVLTVRDREK